MTKKNEPPPLANYNPQLDGDVAGKAVTHQVHTPTGDKRSDGFGNSQSKTPKPVKD